ncbi:MAG: response regulator transcription factor [Microthrixaceae bacterium]|nr:response regulator transcription factor [Microthrixaceae bacterium]
MQQDHPTAEIVVADDDRAIRESLARLLEAEGHSVRMVCNGAEVLEEQRRRPAGLIVLDLMMPGVDGLTVCRVLRSEQDRVPILVLTARGEASDRVAGLDAGADDYLAKPFDPGEFLARVRALLRRCAPGDTDPGSGGTPERIVAGGLVVDPGSRLVHHGREALELTRTEFDLLELLARNAGLVLPRAEIYDAIWGYDFGPDSKNLAVYIGYLRRKLEAVGAPELIHTVRGVGYVLRSSADDPGDEGEPRR